MKRILLFFLAFTAFQHTQAQSETPAAYVVYDEFNWWNLQIGQESIVFADLAYIRDYPGLKGKITDSLYNGTTVKITSEGYNPTTIRGFNEPWHKISYLKDGKTKTGFIWLGLLALGTDKKQDQQFVYGILKFENETSYSPSTYFLEIKCLDTDKNILARAHYPAQLDGQTGVESKMLPNMGLSNLQSIHRIGFLSEACGISTNHYYFGWNGQEFTTLLEKTSVGDAGIFYSEETILFPSEHKLDPNLVIKDTEVGENIEEDEMKEINYKIKRKREKFIWDGKHLSLVMEMK